MPLKLPWGLYRKAVPVVRSDTTDYRWRLVGVFPDKASAEMAHMAFARRQMECLGFIDDFEVREVTLTQVRDTWRKEGWRLMEETC